MYVSIIKKVTETINRILEEQIKIYMDKEKVYDQEKVITLNKNISDNVKNTLKNSGDFGKRYKFVVHCVIGK
jgi:hypothetical protein